MTNIHITIKDVVRKANVSIKTVSNVINHRDDQMEAFSERTSV
ncbi:LacI family DNA-binding transcriptional regulator [Bifidobacterium aemilianum]|nr:LacI family DNA-binding transcriptional regulator [Bifidobacterium aemilianum]